MCVFNLSAISQAFNGPFKYQENSRSAWLPYPNPNPNFQVIPGGRGALRHHPFPPPPPAPKDAGSSWSRAGAVSAPAPARAALAPWDPGGRPHTRLGTCE